MGPRQVPNVGSAQLIDAENEVLFAVVGSDAACLAAGVVELLRGTGDRWARVLRGVVCLVKDYARCSFFFRLFDIVTQENLWELQLFRGFELHLSAGCAQLLTFESDGVVYGFNFACPREATSFLSGVQQRSQRDDNDATPSSFPRSPNAGKRAPKPPPPPKPSAVATDTGVTVVAKEEDEPELEKPSGVAGFLFGGSRKKKKKTKDSKRILKKTDIGAPTNFQHTAHVGWEEDPTEMAQELFAASAAAAPKSGAVAANKKPPKPSRSAPPPPPAPSSLLVVKPPPGAGPPPPPADTSIAKQPAAAAAPVSGRGGLLAEIQAGKQLRSAAESAAKSPTAAAAPIGLAGALQHAMQQRRTCMVTDDEEEEDDSDDDDEDSGWDD